MIPAAWLPQMPKACTSWSSGSLNSRPAAAAAAKLPVIAVGWKCRACSAPGTASPMRHITSTAAISASSRAGPPAPLASPTASAAVTATQPVWTMASSRVSSKSRPWASVALASTALAAATRRAVPSSRLSGAPPRRSATPSTARPKSSPAAASALPSVSSASSVALAVTAAGTSPSESATTKRARRRAAVGAGTVTSIYRAAARMSIPAQPPDLLGRPALRPRRRHVRMARGGAGRRAQLE